MKKFILIILLSLVTTNYVHAQSSVVEISWVTHYIQYNGLMVMYPDNTGIFVVKYFLPNIGWIWVTQDAVLTNQYDLNGHCTSFINCYYPKSVPQVPYAADNFIIYPNGAMYTQDALGNWSTLITARPVERRFWPVKFTEYRLNY